MSPTVSLAPMIRVQGEHCFVFLQTVKLKPKPVELFIGLGRDTNGNLIVVFLVG